ncbi:hypothetical protein VTL71DRAFT_15813 [Oculimacula yallundae]|uniref:Uncharacterized protein n=1 Tax=Oculimacula yallundae TaxID=86028 RepID=A0ABR4CCQ5_9HELO
MGTAGATSALEPGDHQLQDSRFLNTIKLILDSSIDRSAARKQEQETKEVGANIKPAQPRASQPTTSTPHPS